MKVFACRIIMALVLMIMGFSLSSCGGYKEVEEDPAPSDGLYVPRHILDKMDEQKKSGKWRSQY